MRNKNGTDNYHVGVGAGTHKKNYSRQHPSELNYRNHQPHFPMRQRGSASMPNSRPRDRKLERGTESERSSVSGSRHRNNERYCNNWNYNRPKYPSNSRASNFHKTFNRGRNVFNLNQNRQYSSNDRWGRPSKSALHRSKFPVQQDSMTSGPAPSSSNATAKRKSPEVQPKSSGTLILLTVKLPAEKNAFLQPPLQTETRGNLAKDHFDTNTHNNKRHSHQHPSERDRKSHHQHFPPIRQNDSILMSNSEPRDFKIKRGAEQSYVSGSSHRNNEGHPTWNYRRSDNHNNPSNSRDSRPSNYTKMRNYRGENAYHQNKNHEYSSNGRWNPPSDPGPQRSLLPLKEDSVTAAINCSSKDTVKKEAFPGIKESQDTRPVDNNPLVVEGFLCPQCNIRYKTKSYRNRHKYTAKCKQIAGVLLKASTGSDSGN